MLESSQSLTRPGAKVCRAAGGKLKANFETDKANITSAIQKELDAEIGSLDPSFKNCKVLLVGAASNTPVGNLDEAQASDYNLNLAYQRASAVVQYLKQKLSQSGFSSQFLISNGCRSFPGKKRMAQDFCAIVQPEGQVSGNEALQFQYTQFAISCGK